MPRQKKDINKTPQERYFERNGVQKNLRFYKTTEQDILDHIEKIDNLSGYIKGLIRQDMARKAAEQEIQNVVPAISAAELDDILPD